MRVWAVCLWPCHRKHGGSRRVLSQSDDEGGVPAAANRWGQVPLTSVKDSGSTGLSRIQHLLCVQFSTGSFPSLRAQLSAAVTRGQSFLPHRFSSLTVVCFSGLGSSEL